MKKHILRLSALWLVLAMLFLSLASCSFSFGGNGGNGGSEDGKDNEDDTPAGPQVVLNEVCSKNTYYRDPTDRETYDWIELYNTTENEISLKDWGISDRQDKVKHIFTEDITIPAYGFLILWACGEEFMSGKASGGVYLPFSLSKTGEDVFLFSTRGALVHSLSVPELGDNISFGYRKDGRGDLVKMLPSFGETNDDAASALALDTSVASFSHESGFYDSMFTLKVSVPTGYTVYYTDDSTVPTTASAQFPSTGLTIRDATEKSNVYSTMYTGILEQSYVGYSKIYGVARSNFKTDKCTVLRFRVVSPEGLETETITKSFFVGSQFRGARDGYAGMSVVSLVTAPDNLYGQQNGLFVNSKYWTKTNDERPVNFAYFDADKNFSFDQNIGMRLHGTSTRGYNQKSMTLFARKKYGSGDFKKSVFGGVDTCGSLVLRTDGVTKLQEGFLQSFVSDRELSTCDYEPTVVFVDGEYYGVFNMMERFSEDYAEAHYGVDGDNVYVVKKGSEGNVSGALNAYQSTFVAPLSTDLTKASNWETLVSCVDVQSLADIIAAQLILCNMDWSFKQNIAFWRVIDPSKEDPTNPYADGKWRAVLYDLDFAAGCWKPVANWAGRNGKNLDAYIYTAESNAFTAEMPFAGGPMGEDAYFKNLVSNSAFRLLFARTYQDMCNVNFSPDEAVAKTEAAIDRIKYSMKKQFRRFGVPVTAYLPGSKDGNSDSDWKVGTYFGGYEPVNGAPPLEISADAWVREMQFLVDFFRDRSGYAMTHLGSYLGFTGTQKTVTLSVSDPAGGILLLNGVTNVPLADGTWQGSYFTDCTVTVTAVAAEGYHFTGWTVSGATLSSSTDAVTTVSFSDNFTLTANFAPN